MRNFLFLFLLLTLSTEVNSTEILKSKTKTLTLTDFKSKEVTNAVNLAFGLDPNMTMPLFINYFNLSSTNGYFNNKTFTQLIIKNKK